MPKLNRRDVCRLCLDDRLSNREIARVSGVSATTVGKYRSLLRIHSVFSEELRTITDDSLDDLLQTTHKGNRKDFVEPNWEVVCEEYKKRDVTVSLLYAEYVDAASSVPDAVIRSASSFARELVAQCKRFGVTMRQEHVPGREMFVDYSGKHLYITNPKTGERAPVELFVAALGASKKLFVTAVHSQKKADWIEANTRALEYFGGATLFIVPDNLKSAVLKPKRFNKDAIINRSYLQFAEHYGTLIVPTRSVKPQDKALAEIGVRITNIWIVARLRNHIFFSIEELNEAILKLLLIINNKRTRGLQWRSRQELFDELEAKELKPLPGTRHVFADWFHDVRVPKDYHIMYRHDFYSVPHRLVYETVSFSVSRTTLTVYSRSMTTPVAVHNVGIGNGESFTQPEHMPDKHRLYQAQNVQDFLKWAKGVSPSAHAIFNAILDNPRIPAIHAIRHMMRAQKIDRHYGRSRFIEACNRANSAAIYNIENVANILKNDIDLRPPSQQTAPAASPVRHNNVRGPGAYKASHADEASSNSESSDLSGDQQNGL